MLPGGPKSSVPGAGLEETLADRADPDGFVPFDRFMETVLYAPGFGYYERERSPFGRAGDFYTAPQVHPLFGRCLASRAVDFRRGRGGRGPCFWVELGPGDGTLAEAVVPSLAGSDPAGGWEVVLVERSAALAGRALARAADAGRAVGIPVRSVGSLAELGPFAGVVVGNEVLDAQPVRRLLWTGPGWTELGVRLGEGRLVPAERPLGTVPAELAGHLPRDPGTVVEVSPARDALVREVADHLSDGLCVLLDFGAERDELWAGHPRGTLAVLRGHTREDDPLAHPGESDLSAFVDFTAAREAARRSGLREVAYRSQAEALTSWGLERLLQEELARLTDAAAQVKARLAAKSLLFGFGTFKVLELAARAS